MPRSRIPGGRMVRRVAAPVPAPAPPYATEVTPVPFALPPEQLAGKVVVVTGASRGLGAGLAARFAQHGAVLGLCARTEPAPPAGARALCAAVDVTDAVAVEAFGAAVAAQLGPIDLWVNNAGVLEPLGPQRDHDPVEVLQQLGVTGRGDDVVASIRKFDDGRPSDGPPGSGHKDAHRA